MYYFTQLFVLAIANRAIANRPLAIAHSSLHISGRKFRSLEQMFASSKLLQIVIKRVKLSFKYAMGIEERGKKTFKHQGSEADIRIVEGSSQIT